MKLFNLISISKRLVPLLDRWLLSQLIPPLLFSICLLSIISLSLGVMFELIRNIVEFGLPFLIALRVLLLRLPGFLVISFPMAMLMSSLFVYSRLSSNSEMTALRSIGYSLKRIILSTILLGLFMSFFTFVLNDLVVPKANASADIILKRGIGTAMHSGHGSNIMYSRFGKIVNSLDNSNFQGLTHLFYAKEFRNKEMNDVTLLDFSRFGYTKILVADKATWFSDESKWDFKDGKIITLAPNNTSTSIGFENYSYPLDAGIDRIEKFPKDANNMTISQTIEAQRYYKIIGDKNQERKMKVRIQEKFTLPMACIVFALIGSSLGSKKYIQSSKANSLGLSIILILFYYIFSFTFSSLGVNGSLDPIIAAWSPIFISIFLGCFLIIKADR